MACVSTRIGKGQTGTVSAQGVCALRGSQISIRPASLKYVVCLLYDDKYFSVACRPEMTYILYCPGQAPMGTRSSNTKNRGWAVARRRWLNGSTIPVQVPTTDAKLAAKE